MSRDPPVFYAEIDQTQYWDDNTVKPKTDYEFDQMQVLSEQASRFYVLKNLKEKNSVLFVIFLSSVWNGWI